LIALVIIVALAVLLIPRQTPPTQVFTPTYWPTNGWQTSTPEEQGFDSTKLAEGLQAFQLEFNNNLSVFLFLSYL
jgi:hypothetical protein